MATIKANKDKARFVSNTISQDALDGDWVDHEVVTKYKLPEIVVDGTSTSTSLVSSTELVTDDSVILYNTTDDMVSQAVGTVTPSIDYTSVSDGNNALTISDNQSVSSGRDIDSILLANGNVMTFSNAPSTNYLQVSIKTKEGDVVLSYTTIANLDAGYFSSTLLSDGRVALSFGVVNTASTMIIVVNESGTVFTSPFQISTSQNTIHPIVSDGTNIIALQLANLYKYNSSGGTVIGSTYIGASLNYQRLGKSSDGHIIVTGAAVGSPYDTKYIVFTSSLSVSQSSTTLISGEQYDAMFSEADDSGIVYGFIAGSFGLTRAKFGTNGILIGTPINVVASVGVNPIQAVSTFGTNKESQAIAYRNSTDSKFYLKIYNSVGTEIYSRIYSTVYMAGIVETLGYMHLTYIDTVPTPDVFSIDIYKFMRYQAPITGLTVAPTKAFFNKTIDTTLSAEDTGKCLTSEREYITIDDSTASDGSNIVSPIELISGERIVVDGEDALGGSVTVDADTNISNGIYTGNAYDFSAISSDIRGMLFNQDGTKMYIHGYGTDAIYQYSLSTSFDLSTATSDGVSLSLGGQDIYPLSVTFSSDGNRILMVGNNSDTVYQYNLATSWNLNTASYASKSFLVSSQTTTPTDVALNTLGTKMYIVNNASIIYEYNLSVAFDVSTASYTDSISLSVQDGAIRKIVFANNGSIMYVLGNSQDSVFQYSLSVSFDVSTAAYSGNSMDISSQASSPYGLTFGENNTKLYINDSAGIVYQYATGLYTQLLPNHTGTTKPTVAYRKGGEDLTFVSSTTSEYVGTNPRSGLITTGDVIQLNGVSEVVCSEVVESVGSVLGANDEFETVLYTGNSSTQTIPMVNITGGVDFVWAKCRSTAADHIIIDSLRGDEQKLVTHSTAAEIYDADTQHNLAASSFDLGNDGHLNYLGRTYVAWCASLPNHTPSNTDGTIASETKSNSFMSVVSYTGTKAIATVGHSLGIAPELIIVKNRDTAVNWSVYHVTAGNTYELQLDTNIAAALQTRAWDSTSPTSTVFTLGDLNSNNGTSNNMIAYAFTSVAGKCKVGSYTGTGTSVNIVCGFQPSWIMVKRTDVAGDWHILDDQRLEGIDSMQRALYPNLSAVEASYYFNELTPYADGFSTPAYEGHINISGGTYIYLAIAKDTLQDIPQYTATIPTQATAPTSAKVLDRSVTPTVASDTFDGTDTFTKTYNTVTKTARDVEYGFVADEEVEIVQLNLNQNMEP